MEVLREFHACDGVRLPFGTTCTLLDHHRNDIIEQATRVTAVRSGTGPAGGWFGAGAHVVTAPLERDGQRSATMAMHWIRGGPAGPAEEQLSAWLHCHLRLLPRQAGDEAVTELLLTARCEASPPEAGAFGSELCAGFLRSVAEELERRAASESARG